MRGEEEVILVVATVPDFYSLNVWLALALFLALALSLARLVGRSWDAFPATDGAGLPLGRVIRMLSVGRVRPGSFYGTAALLFAVAAGTIAWLNDYTYVDSALGLSAYTEPLEQRAGNSGFRLRDDGPRLRAPIFDCGWNDRFSADELRRRWDESGDGGAQPPRDPYVAEYLEFRDAVEQQFIQEAPAQITGMSDQLTPVFAVLGALFLMCARGLLRPAPGELSLSTGQVAMLALLAHAFVMLAYFAILQYHVMIEISGAVAASRIVCVEHVTAPLVAQTRCLFVAGALLFVLVALSPRSIIRNL